ncbi:MAG: condensation domain-containing protein, partial [Chloroflexota bacterium]
MTATDRRLSELSKKKQELLKILLEEKKKQQSANQHTIPLRPQNESVPLSFVQQRLWFLCKLDPANVAYNVPAGVRLIGHIDIAMLEQSVNEVIRRHESLRTTFIEIDGQPIQNILPHLTITLECDDLSMLSEQDREHTVQHRATQEVQKPFNLEQGPLLRLLLLRTAEDQHVVLLIIHQIISDVWSIRVFIRELLVIYQAFLAEHPSSLAALPIQYADFAHWQRRWMQGEILEVQLDYWRRHLADAPKFLELPPDRPRPPVQSFWGAKYYTKLDQELTESLKALSREEGVSLFMTMLAAFKVLLYRYTNSEQVVVATPIANRTKPELEGMIGFLVNSLVLNTNMHGNPTFRDLLQRVRSTTLGAFAHQDIPFERLVMEMQNERDMSRNPLYQVMFIFQNLPDAPLETPRLTMQPIPIETGTTQCDLTLDFMERDGILTGWFDYDSALFDVETIIRLEHQYQAILYSIVADSSCRLWDIPMLTESDKQMLTKFHQPKSYSLPSMDISTVFTAQVAQTPERVAVVCGAEAISYAALATRVQHLAAYL